MGISADLQRIILARLEEAVPSVEGRVYDNPDEGTVMPFISIGASDWFDDSAECIRSRRETVQIDIWAADKPNKSACKDATDEVAAALHGWADTGRLTMHEMEVTMARVMSDPEPGVVHGVVQVEAMVEIEELSASTND